MFISHQLRSWFPYLLLLGRLGAAETVPAELVDDGGGDASGACSLCQVKTLKDAEGGTKLELYYDDDEDERATLHANITLTCLLSNGAYSTQVIEGVDLVAGQTFWYELQPNTGWYGTLEVKYLWVEVTDASG